MQFSRQRRANRMMLLEITPMIDVVFLLIIFFMTTAKFAEQSRADLDLPREKGEQREEAEEAGLIVNITADGEIILSGETLTLQELEERIAAQIALQRGRRADNLRLMIRADRNASTDRLNAVVRLLQRLGVGAARVATEVPN